MNELVRQLRKKSRQFPHTEALFDGTRLFTHGELWDQVDTYRTWLSHLKIERLGILLPNTLHWIAIDLAALSLGIPTVAIPDFFSGSQK